MNSGYTFQIGQRVRMYDYHEGAVVYGEVMATTARSVFIWWDGADEIEYDRMQYPEIFLELTNKTYIRLWHERKK